MKTKTPNPGSDEAIKLGCKCPVLDNAHGNGCGLIDNGKPLFWINSNCHLHNPNPDDDLMYKCSACWFMTNSSDVLDEHLLNIHNVITYHGKDE